jgi:integrase
MAAADLTSRTRRSFLEPRRAPYWFRIGAGDALGWRRLSRGAAGRWVLRRKRGTVYQETVLGVADDLVPANGRTVLSYADSLRVAQARIAAEADGGSEDNRLTLRMAIEKYEGRLVAEGRHGAARDARILFKRVSDALLATSLRRIGEDDLRSWIESLRAANYGPARVDRVRSILRAAINSAPALSQPPQAVLRSGLRVPDTPPFARRAVLDATQVGSFIMAARAIGDDLGLLVQVLAETGHRVDQIRRCRVSDLDADTRRLHVPVSRKGRGRKSRTHIVCPITANLAERLRTAAAERDADAPLLTNVAFSPLRGAGIGWTEAGRREWRHADHARGIAEAVRRAELPPGTTAYALRHSRIVALLMSGLPVQAVAAQCDTSAAIIAQHYGRFIADAVAEDRVRAALPEVSP